MSASKFIGLVLATWWLGLASPVLAADNVQLTQNLLNRVSNAQKQLAATEKNIASEKAQLARQLNSLEQQVLALQQKTAAARRLSDESTLSLNQLQSRVKEWQEQQVYQQNLLNRFIHQQQLAAQPSALALEQKLALIKQFSQNLQGKLRPQWQDAEVVMTNGKIASLATLTVGPLHWYWSDEADAAGIAKLDNGRLHAQLSLSGSDSSQLKDTQQGSGALVFDPTQSRALARQQHQESAWQHLVKGGIWVIPIMLFAGLALSIALYKSLQLLRLPKLHQFSPAHLSAVLSGNSDTSVISSIKGQQRALLDIAMHAKSERQRDDQLFIQLQQDKHWLERWLMVIGITASVAPLLGLLGTVSGMIETFKMMTLFGSGDPEVVSGGIAQALITTELGLVVAIPALVLNAMLSRKAKGYYHQLENFAILLSQSPADNGPETQREAA